jgi:hypothetical protein
MASDLARERVRDQAARHGGGDQNESDRNSFEKKVAQGRSARAYANLRINLSHDQPHSLGQACRSVFSTAAGRLFFKLEKRNTRQ